MKALRGVEYRGIRLLSLFALQEFMARTFQRYLIAGVITDLSQPASSLKGRIVKRLPSTLDWANRFLKPLLTQHQVGAFK